MEQASTIPRSPAAVGSSLLLRELPWFTSGVAAGSLATAIATFKFVGSGSSSNTSDWYWLLGIVVVLSLLVYGVLNVAVTSDRRLDALGIGIGVLSIVSLVVFWTGAPVVLGFVAVMLGVELEQGRGHRDDIRARGMVAYLLGAAGIALGFVAAILG